jgi:uncharacterized phage protein (TIGR02220 family)
MLAQNIDANVLVSSQKIKIQNSINRALRTIFVSHKESDMIFLDLANLDYDNFEEVIAGMNFLAEHNLAKLSQISDFQFYVNINLQNETGNLFFILDSDSRICTIYNKFLVLNYNKKYKYTADETRLVKKKNNIQQTQDLHRQVCDHLNLVCKSKYNPSSAGFRKYIDSRVKEGFCLEDFKTVIDSKAREWLGTDFEKYLRPQTLFGNKFEAYLNDPSSKKIKATSQAHNYLKSVMEA